MVRIPSRVITRVTLLVLLCVGCATLTSLDLNSLYGEPDINNRNAEAIHALASEQGLPDDFFSQQVQPVIESRCVVCHACYDAPCQLKMSSGEGIVRGANKELVYQGARLIAATPNRLFIDAHSTEAWRERGFFPVLNERQQTGQANTQASVLARMLTLKQQHPLPADTILDDSFDFSLDRSQQCPTIEEFEGYAESQPLAGMPYGLPALNTQEHETLMRWITAGAPLPAPDSLSAEQLTAIQPFEDFLNQPSLKAQLTARYIYEHLFTSHLYFDAFNQTDFQPQFYTLVRSSTPPGEEIAIVATRRPFDEPNVERVYYRLQPVVSTIVNKTHQPYALNNTLLEKWQSWFIAPEYSVNQLPSYEAEVAANPLIAFSELPVNARYRFMLERAENTIESFIKGPVCRGQVALNVINDHFWVYFVTPEIASSGKLNEFYASQQDNLHLPAEQESTAFAVNWLSYANKQGDYLRARSEFLNEVFTQGRHLSLDSIWDGEGKNQNASLTVFRHFDNATVVQGLVGAPPKTAWLIDYALLERIHYLLVAGFDVYGNYGHQLLTRLYMDFLRMEGESNFLTFLPPATRHEELKNWYQNSGPELTKFLEGDINPFQQESGIQYQTDAPKQELFSMLAQRLAPVQPAIYDLKNSEISAESQKILSQLGTIAGSQASVFPELTMLMVIPEGSSDPDVFTLLRNSAHYNISSLFSEDENRNPQNDDLSLVHGLVGSYPNAFWQVKEADLKSMVARAQNIRNETDYQGFLSDYGVRRSAADFWQFSDTINQAFNHHSPIEAGWLDYSRLENR